MTTLLMLARASLWSRKTTVALTVLSVATSFALLVSVERLRSSARSSFESTVSGTDLLVGSRGSGVQLLLYSVFRLGEPVQELTWESYEAIADHPEVSWSVPLALGDSVQGFRVLGTTAGYFKHYRYGAGQPLELEDGQAFDKDAFDAVLGSDVAESLGWSVGHRFPVQHGIAKDAHAHDEQSFIVAGILAPTGTPVDRTVHVPLAGLAAAHDEHASEDGDHADEHEHDEHDHAAEDGPDHQHDAEHGEEEVHAKHDGEDHEDEEVHAKHDGEDHEHNHEDEAHAKHDGEDHEDEEHAQHDAGDGPGNQDGDGHGHEGGELARLSTVSAAMIGLRSKMGLFRMRAWINDFPAEPLMAVMPARAFQQLWSTVSVVERSLVIIGVLVSLAGVIALVATLLATVNERRREMALLRSVGASPLKVAGLIVGEAAMISLTSVMVALASVYSVELLWRETLVSRFGLRIDPVPIATADLPWIAVFLIAAGLVSMIPAAVSYRRSLSDGLLVRT
ncbi:MAG: FtsX-like permease family protein [Myxococcota bacterium]